jgi:hypothetical protein
MTQGISFLPVTATTLVRFRDSRWASFVEQSALGLVSFAYFSFPPSISFHQYSKHIYLSPTLYSLGNR